MSEHDVMRSWDAVETAARIRTGDVHAEDVLEAAIDRAKAAAPLHAIVTDTFERARDGSPDAGPLRGVPTFIKDLAQVGGVRTTWGSAAVGHYVSRKSDPFVERLEGTGVACLGKSATPEFGLTATTESTGFAPCRNPWNPDHSVGGSSGGAGALVAAGVVPLAHGSDGGGSIRIPASCCGLVGLKPTRGRYDMEASGLLPVNVAVHGCVTRTVRDTVAFWSAIEATPGKLPPIGAVAEHPSRPLRIGAFSDAPLGTPVHLDCRDGVKGAATLLESLGHQVEMIDCPFDEQVALDFTLYWAFLAYLHRRAGKLLVHPGFTPSEVEPWTDGLARYFGSQKVEGMKATLRLRRFGAVYAQVLERFDVLVCPTLGTPPPRIGTLAVDLDFETKLERLLEFSPFTLMANVAGAPAISLPLAKSAAGLPVGIQLCAAQGEDRLLLEVARSMEVAQPWELYAPRESWVNGPSRAHESEA